MNEASPSNPRSTVPAVKQVVTAALTGAVVLAASAAVGWSLRTWR